MSENGHHRTAAADASRDLRQRTFVHTDVHLRADSLLGLTAYPDENRVVLSLGEAYGQINIYVKAADLDRLHGLLDAASGELDRAIPSVVETAFQAYAQGWDAAIGSIETATGEPVPAHTPALPTEVG